jgi:AcrR family transcriptional regulator
MWSARGDECSARSRSPRHAILRGKRICVERKFAFHARFGQYGVVSLRERKKDQTRRALSVAALELAIERGLDRVVVDDIAAAAGVSARTFNNYFPSKEAAVVGEGAERAEAMRAALRARPVDEPLWTALRHAIATLFAADVEPDRAWVAKAQLIKNTPALRVEQLRSDTFVQAGLAAEIAARTGTDARRDLYPDLVASAVIGATRTALAHWLDADPPASPPTPLGELVDHALAQLANGLPAPDTPRRRRKDQP